MKNLALIAGFSTIYSIVQSETILRALKCLQPPPL